MLGLGLIASWSRHFVSVADARDVRGVTTLVAFLAPFCPGTVFAQPGPPTPPAVPADEGEGVPAGVESAPSVTPSALPAANAPPATKSTPAAVPASQTNSAAPSGSTTESSPASSVRASASRDAAPKLPGVTSPASSSSIRIGGYIQGQYQASAASEDRLQPGGTPLNHDRFLVRRGRVRFDHDWRWASAALELDANTVRGVGVGIRRAEAALVYRSSEEEKAPPLVALSVGVMDIPFGYELLESSRTRFFMERSVGSGALFPTDGEVGLKLGGTLGFLRYGVALMNGEPLDDRGFPRDPNAAKDVVGRVGVDVKPIAPLTVFGGASFARGTGFHPGQDATKDSIAWLDLDDDGVVSGLDEISVVPGRAATPSENFSRWALALDLGFTLVTALGTSKLYGEAFLASNYDRGLLRTDPVASGGDVRQAGGAVAFVQDVTRYGVAGFRASFYDPSSSLIEESSDAAPQVPTIVTLSPLAGFVLREQARLLVQYDFVPERFGRDAPGLPAEATNHRFTARVQVEL
jgi:hypothetical protein